MSQGTTPAVASQYSHKHITVSSIVWASSFFNYANKQNWRLKLLHHWSTAENASTTNIFDVQRGHWRLMLWTWKASRDYLTLEGHTANRKKLSVVTECVDIHIKMRMQPKMDGWSSKSRCPRLPSEPAEDSRLLAECSIFARDLTRLFVK